MTSPIADGVLAATHRLVQQAMSGQWQEVPKTIAERRVLLDQLSAGASPQDQQWLSALKQAMAESDAVVTSLTEARDVAAGYPARGADTAPEFSQPAAAAQNPTAEIDAVMNMILGSKE